MAAVVAALQGVIDSASATSEAEHDAAMRALHHASEQLDLVLEGFGDRVLSGTRALESLADELSSSTRASEAYADRLAAGIQASVERLGRRLEPRPQPLPGAVAPPDGPSQDGDEMSRASDGSEEAHP